VHGARLDDARLSHDPLRALTNASDLSATYDQAEQFFPDLAALDDRARDLWEPLISIAAIADAERGDGQKTFTDELAAFAIVLCQARDGAAEDSTVVLVINALQEIAAQKRNEGLFHADDDIILSPTELAGLLKQKLGWDKLGTKGLAALLSPLDLFSNHTRHAGTIFRAYRLNEKTLAELSERYTPTNAAEESKSDFCFPPNSIR
jgi:hypothetical protein